MSDPDYLPDYGSDLLIAQDTINIKLVELNYILKMQSFSVPVLIGHDPLKKERMTISPGNPIVIPQASSDEQSASFRFETPNPNIDALLKEIDNKIRRIGKVYGLSESDFRSTGSPSSGYALRLENKNLENRLCRSLPHYERSEKALFNILKRVWNYERLFLPSSHPFSDISFSDESMLSVHIVSPVSEDSPEEQRAHWSFLFENGLSDRADYLSQTMRITRDEAVKMLNEREQKAGESVS